MFWSKCTVKRVFIPQGYKFINCQVRFNKGFTIIMPSIVKSRNSVRSVKCLVNKTQSLSLLLLQLMQILLFLL